MEQTVGYCCESHYCSCFNKDIFSSVCYSYFSADSVWQATLWCRYHGDAYVMIHDTVLLNFDPSQEMHTYSFCVKVYPTVAEQVGQQNRECVSYITSRSDIMLFCSYVTCSGKTGNKSDNKFLINPNPT